MLQHVEHLGEQHAARGRRRCAHEPQPAPARAHRLALGDAVGREVLQRPDAARRAHAGHQALGQRPAVEARRPLPSQPRQGGGEVRLAQPPALGGDLAVLQKDPRRRGRGAQGREAQAREAAVAGIDRKALPGEADGGGEAARERQAPVARRDVGERRRLAGHGGGERPVEARARPRPPLGVEVHVARGGERGALAPVHHDLEPVARAVQQPEAAPAQARAVGLDHGERRRGRHRRVEGVSAGGEDLEGGLGGKRVRRGDGHRRGAPGGRGGRRRREGAGRRQQKQQRRRRESKQRPLSRPHARGARTWPGAPRGSRAGRGRG